MPSRARDARGSNLAYISIGSMVRFVIWSFHVYVRAQGTTVENRSLIMEYHPRMNRLKLTESFTEFFGRTSIPHNIYGYEREKTSWEHRVTSFFEMEGWICYPRGKSWGLVVLWKKRRAQIFVSPFLHHLLIPKHRDTPF